ncbi:hypothetical protein GQX73_g10007 [Xylaria multiplex]|uniref:DUF7136 domain-containing protein n=1 Tax=Xylaria multiplex TaxID=323545 RepID=A0A7C8MKI7_9PEZI|nr:hypothetical protein GQX73_g10007 [Xylaria multiplex]
MPTTNLYRDNQRYLVSATTKLNSPEGRFALYWKLGVNNCSIANVNANGTSTVNNLYTSYTNETYFTLQNAAQPPDLVAATNPDTCASMAAIVLNITGNTPVPGVLPIPGLSPEEQLQCPILRNATVSPTPCSVRLNQTQAASISASATVVACDKWPTDYPGYKAACESEPESAASPLNTVTVQAGTAGNLMAVVATRSSSVTWTLARAQQDLCDSLTPYTFDTYKNHFTPVPKDDDKPLRILLDLVGIFGTIAGATYFDDFLKALPSAFAASGDAKDGTLALIAGGVSIAKDLASGNSVSNRADVDIDILGRIIAGGRLVPGSYDGHTNDESIGPLTPPNTTSTELTLIAERAFWGFTIPLGWQLSGTHGFVVQSSFDCDISGNPLSDYMTEDVEKKTKCCHSATSRLYYLVAAKGYGEFCTGDGGCADIFFQLPPGLDQLR